MAEQIFTSLWGAFLERSFLRKSYKWSSTQIEQYQIQQLNKVLNNASQLEGYAYLKGFQKNLKSLSELARIPLLEKAAIKDAPEKFVDKNVRWLVEDHTSGSTGNPLTVYLTQKQKALEFGYVLRYYRRFGYQMGDKMVAFRSYIPKTQSAPKSKYVKSRNELLFSVYDMTAENLTEYIKEFNLFRPRFVRGYPTSVYIVANHALQNSISIIPPTAIFCSSEVLSDQQKDVIERAFGAPAINWYGSNERAITASQCQLLEALHVHEEAGILEVVNASGQSSLEDSSVVEGEIIVTGLINSAMPLIRYKLGDSAVITKKPCACGFNGTSLERIIGRTDDIIFTRAGKSVPPVRFYTLFEKHPAVSMFQIVYQSERDFVDVNLVAKYVDENKLINDLKLFLGEEIGINLHYVAEISPEKSGKRKHIKVIK